MCGKTGNKNTRNERLNVHTHTNTNTPFFFPTAMPFTIYFKNTIRNCFDAISKRSMAQRHTQLFRVLYTRDK